MAAPLTRSDFERLVESATPEKGEEDWAVIMDICDKASQGIHGPKDCLHECLKRLKNSSTSVQVKTLTLLDALVQNCGAGIHVQVATKDVCSIISSYLKKASQTEKVRMLKMLKSWCEKELKNNPSYSAIPNLCQRLKEDGYFKSANIHVSSDAFATASSSTVHESEASDPELAKAIELSLKDAKKSASLYPTMSLGEVSSSQSTSTNLYASVGASNGASSSRELQKVRALYDFVAAEDNELTFTAGELIDILDGSDANWWKGRTWRGEGLFPSNFVTSDLSAEPEVEEPRGVQFNDMVEVRQLDPEAVEIDEGKIDEALALLQNADPTGENEVDSAEMLTLEEECKIMGSLIDQELEKVDTSHNELMALHSKLVDGVNLYMELMAAPPPAQPKALPPTAMGGGYLPQPAQYSSTHPSQLESQLASHLASTQSYAMNQPMYGAAGGQSIPNQQQMVPPNLQSTQIPSQQAGHPQSQALQSMQHQVGYSPTQPVTQQQQPVQQYANGPEVAALSSMYASAQQSLPQATAYLQQPTGPPSVYQQQQQHSNLASLHHPQQQPPPQALL